MANQKVLIADAQFLAKRGLKTLLSELEGFTLSGEAANSDDLYEALRSQIPDIVVIDFEHPSFAIADLKRIKTLAPQSKIIAITTRKDRLLVMNAISQKVNCYILKECGEDEVIDALKAAANNERFFCVKILDIILEGELNEKSPGNLNTIESCDPVKLSDRETEIIQLIAEGYTYKEIADQLYLSSHTVSTHRKNIMKKLTLKNTAGIVRYAIKENLVLAQ